MSITTRRYLLLVVLAGFSTGTGYAETVLNLSFGKNEIIDPDIELVSGVLSTVQDSDNSITSPGDQTTDATFEGFAVGQPGIADIINGSFTLDGVAMVGAPAETPLGGFSSVTQQTTGGTFDLFDAAGDLLLSGTLNNGLLTGSTSGATSGGFFNLDFGTFTGPASSPLFQLLDPTKASLSISFTGIASPGSAGMSVVDGVLQDFIADATANVDAATFGGVAPEPTSMSLGLLAVAGIAAIARRRR